LSRRTRLERIAVGGLMLIVISVLGGIALLTPTGDGAPAQMKLSPRDMRSIVPAAAAPSNSPTISSSSAGAQASLPTPRTSEQPSVTHTPTNVNQFTRRTAVEARKIVPSLSHAVFRVSATSFLRNRPAADAEIIDSLRPGIRVEVTNVGGEYFRVRELGNENVHGFVHKEDAFFEPFH
jgi:hypothetical protein